MFRDSCTACARDRFIHQEANAATRVTLIQPFYRFYHDRNFPTIGIRGQITCHLPFQRPLSYAVDIHHACRARCIVAYKHLFYYISFNRKCAYSNLSPISVDTSRLIPGRQKPAVESPAARICNGKG